MVVVTWKTIKIEAKKFLVENQPTDAVEIAHVNKSTSGIDFFPTTPTMTVQGRVATKIFEDFGVMLYSL